MNRICPKCNAKLGGYDSFFCTACGAPLSPDLTSREAGEPRVTNLAPVPAPTQVSVPAKAFFNLKGIIGSIFSVAVIVGILFFIENRLGREIFAPQQPAPESTGTPANYVTSVSESDLDWQLNTFGVDSVMTYVPADSEIVIEGNDLDKFGVVIGNFDPVYADLISYLSGKVEQHFVFFAKEVEGTYVWSLVYFPIMRNFEIPQEIVTKFGWLKFSNSTTVGAITTDQTVLDSIAGAKAGFSQTAVYKSSLNSLPKNGKAIVYLTTQRAKDFFKSFATSAKVPANIQKVVESISKENSDYSVIL